MDVQPVPEPVQHPPILQPGQNETPAVQTQPVAAVIQPAVPGFNLKLWRFLAPVIGIVGGMAGLIGSIIQEVAKSDLLGPFVAGPIIEEALKPAGIYFLLAKWPKALTSRRYTAMLTALSGLTFGVIENLIYLNIYIPHPTPTVILIRWTACLALHTGCSFIVGLGIDQSLIAGIKGEIKLFSTNKRYFIIPMIIHSAFNIAAFILNDYLE